MAINKITAEQLFKIKRKSAQALPNKPSAQGYTAEEIKNYLTNFVTDDEDSFKAELDRIVDEINVLIGGIENVTLKNYVIDEIVKKFTEQNPVLNLSFNKETNLLEYETYSDNGSVDILPNGMVFVDGSLLKNKSGSSFYPQTSIDKLIDKIDDKTVREYLLSLQTKLTELQDEHDRDIASLTQSFESILGGDAPEALNTIKELAEALNNNPTQVDDILLQLTNLNTNKVDKIIGKGLSTNDFTNDLKASLEALLQRDLADVSDIPEELKSFTDDSEHRLVTDAEKNAWNSKASAIHQHNISDILDLQKILDSKSDNTHSHTLEEIGAEAKGTASNLISQHNSNTEAHSDIRELIREVRNKVDGINEAISFVNEKQLSDWIAGTYIRSDGKTTNDLFVGQHIYIQEQSERDFWVSSKPVSSINDLTPLPTDKINLEDYVLKENLANVATSGSYNDLLHTPNIYYKLSEMIEDDDHKTITKQKLELIDTNAEKLLEKLDTNLGLTEANKMLVTDSNGNIVTAIAGSMSALIDSLDSSSTTMAPTANQVRILNNIKLDKQQGTENANKYLYVNSLGLIDLATIKTKLSEFINDNNYQTLTEVQALIKAIPTPDVSGQISSHNIDETAHQDIRDAIKNIDLSGYSKTNHTHDYSSLFADINHTHDYATQNDINTAISNLINGAPTTLDTLKEIADAMASNQSVVSALEQSIGNKANTSDLNNYLPLSAGSGKKLTGNLYLTKDTVISNLIHIRGLDSSGNAKSLIALSNTNNVWINYDNSGATIVGGSSLQPFTANHKKTNLGTATASFNNIYGTTIYQNGKQVANAEDIPTKVDALNPNVFIGYNSEENINSEYQVSFKNNDQSYGICWSKFANIAQQSKAPSVCTYNGFFYVNSSVNSLSGADANPFLQYHSEQDFRILTTAYSDTWLQQIATDFRTPYVYVRRCENGTWTDWVKLASTSDLSSYVPTSRTVNGKALSANISLGNKDVGALPDYTLTINHGTAGNPRMVKFASVNYSNAATCFKMGAMTCHDNGVSYQFLTDMLIAVTTAGDVTANIYKFAQSSVGNVDGVARYTGDVFYVNDTTNKIVDFYILCGQYSSSQFTPATKVGSTTINYVTQYSGTAAYYSSGDKVWANGCGNTYARTSDIPSTSGFVNTSSDQTVGGTKTFSNAIYAPVYKSDTSTAGFRLSDSNEMNFSSNVDTIYFGYQRDRIPNNGGGYVSKYQFGNSQGSGAGGTIYCNDVYVDNGSTQVARKTDLGTQVTYSLSGTTLTIIPK